MASKGTAKLSASSAFWYWPNRRSVLLRASINASESSAGPAHRISGESIRSGLAVAEKSGKPGAALGMESEAKKIVLVSPAMAESNNGNWRTAGHNFCRLIVTLRC